MQTVRERNYQKPANLNGRTKKNGVAPHGIRWTVDEYYKMYEQGLFHGKRVELLKGEIFEMSPMLSPHATSIALVYEMLREIFKDGFLIRTQMPVRFSKIDEPEPDVAVIHGSIRDFTDAHPTTATLLVEVAFTSLNFDRTKKLKLYSENDIEEYWIVNLKQRQLEVFRTPVARGESYDYAEKLIFTESESVSPLARPKATIEVSHVLP